MYLYLTTYVIKLGSNVLKIIAIVMQYSVSELYSITYLMRKNFLVRQIRINKGLFILECVARIPSNVPPRVAPGRRRYALGSRVLNFRCFAARVNINSKGWNFGDIFFGCNDTFLQCAAIKPEKKFFHHVIHCHPSKQPTSKSFHSLEHT